MTLQMDVSRGCSCVPLITQRAKPDRENDGEGDAKAEARYADTPDHGMAVFRHWKGSEQ